MVNSYHHLILTLPSHPDGIIGTGTLSGLVSKALTLISIGERYPTPDFFFSTLMGIASSIELSLNPPNLIGRGSIVVA